MGKRIQKAKDHLRENKAVYITGGSCLAIGAVAGGIFLGKGGTQIVDAVKLIHIQWKSPNVINVEMVRPGPKSFVLQCRETQATWPSIRAAAKELGVNPSRISEQIAGKIEHVNGKHFEKLAEI